MIDCEHNWEVSGGIYGECVYEQDFVCQKCNKFKTESVERLEEDLK